MNAYKAPYYQTRVKESESRSRARDWYARKVVEAVHGKEEGAKLSLGFWTGLRE